MTQKTNLFYYIVGMILYFISVVSFGKTCVSSQHDKMISSGFIREICSIEEIAPFVDRHTLVVLDLDNTLIETVQMLGSDEWFEQRFKDFLLLAETSEEAFSKFVPIYRTARKVTEERLIEPKSVKMINNFQKEEVIVLGLTSRDKELYDSTIRNLYALNIDFMLPGSQNMVYSFIPEDRRYAYNGLILLGGQHKGRGLLEYINYLKSFPMLRAKLENIKKIIFVDDKEKYLHQVADNIEAMGFHTFIGFRFAKLDNKVAKAESRMSVAYVQEEFLGKILTDEAANDIVMARKSRKNRS